MGDGKAMQDGVDILEGAEGFLFLVGGAHRVAELMRGERKPTPAEILCFRDNLRARAAYCAARDIDYAMWVFPDKLVALRSLVPDLAPLASLYQSSYADSVAGLPVHYPLAALEGQAACFTRGDTHYSPSGEIEIVALILDSVLPGTGQTFRDQALAGLTVPVHVKGDLARKLERPLKEAVLKPAPVPSLLRASNGLRGNEGLMEILENDQAATSKTLLIFGDSFFRAILHHLAWAFRRIVYCRTRYFHAELVAAVRPDVIFNGAAERYLSTQAEDGARPHFLSYPLLYGRLMKPDAGFETLFARAVERGGLLRGGGG